MTNEEAVRKLEYSKTAYQMLIDEKVDSGILVGKDVKGEWKADTPLDEAYKSMIEALEMGIKAIKALEQEPCDVFDEYGNYKYPSDFELTEPNTATSMPCEDAISRIEVIKSIDEREDVNGKVDAESVRTDIVLLPPVTSQSKTGHWIHYAQSDDCSECGYSTGKYESPSKFCPDCGAMMIEPQERSDKE